MHPPSPEAVLFPSGSPVLRPLALPLTARFDGGQDGRGGLPTPSSTAPLLEAAADAVREQGRTQGPPSATSRGGRVGSPQSAPKQPRTAGPCSRLRRRRGQSGTQGP